MNFSGEGAIAVWAPELEADGIPARLERAGHSAIAVATVDELYALLDQGWQFKLLVASTIDRLKLYSLRAVCNALKLPVLFLVDREQWSSFPHGHSPFESETIRLPGGDVDEWSNELTWRVEALLIRTANTTADEKTRPEMICGNIRFRFNPEPAVFCKGKEVHLQPRQFEVALQLFSNLGDVVPRGLLLRAFWGGRTQKSYASKPLNVCIARIRKMLDLKPENGFNLRAVYGRGYQLRRTMSDEEG